jgi:SSS family transporter
VTLAIHGIDLLVLVVYLVAVTLLGVRLGRGTQDLAGYLLGGRHLPWWAILGSIVATETSTATFLSVPGVAYAQGGDLRFLQLALGYLLGRMLITIVLLPLYFRGQIFTAYEVLDARFGRSTKQLAALIFLVTRNLGDGLRLFLTAIVLERIAQIPLPICIALVGGVTILYTLLGGMKAVVWNDCVQLIVYLAGGLVAGVVLLQTLPGGAAEVLEFGRSQGKFRLIDWSWVTSDPYTVWAAVIGGMFLTLGTHGTDQMMVQRYLCARSQADASRALILSALVVLVQFALFLLLGVGLATFYHLHPPAEAFTTNDQVFATFIVRELPAGRGVIGIVLAAVFAAAMSTLSSSINSSAASAVSDLYLPLWGARQPSGHHQLQASRILTVAFGLLQIAVGILARNLTDSVVTDALAIASFSAGLLLGIFALGIFTRAVGHQAAAVGLAVGLISLLWVRFGLPRMGDDWRIAWPWFPVIGCVTTLAGGCLAHGIGRLVFGVNTNPDG